MFCVPGFIDAQSLSKVKHIQATFERAKHYSAGCMMHAFLSDFLLSLHDKKSSYILLVITTEIIWLLPVHLHPAAEETNTCVD